VLLQTACQQTVDHLLRNARGHARKDEAAAVVEAAEAARAQLTFVLLRMSAETSIRESFLCFFQVGALIRLILCRFG